MPFDFLLVLDAALRGIAFGAAVAVGVALLVVLWTVLVGGRK